MTTFTDVRMLKLGDNCHVIGGVANSKKERLLVSIGLDILKEN